MSEARFGDALVVGASGGIASAVIERLGMRDSCRRIFAVSRSKNRDSGQSEKTVWLQCDYSDAAIESVCAALRGHGADLSRVVICNGILHSDDYQPERRIESVNRAQLIETFQANAVIPLLWLQGLLAVLESSEDCTVAVLSARVGSIRDNRLGGWYSYRASKAALNMLLKTAAVEYARRLKMVKLMAFHPGTTDTALSDPFQKNVPKEKLFTPNFVAERLLGIMDDQTADGTLSFLDWDNKPVDW